MTQLIIGTAEFDVQGYAGKPRPSKREIVQILNRAYEAGVRTLDCADTYGTEDIDGLFSGFKRLFKTREVPLLKGRYYHYKPGEANGFHDQASVYDVEQLQGLKRAIVPMSLADTRFTNVKHLEDIYARSVFNRGKLLEEGYTVRECLTFVYRQQPTGIIVGVSSLKELEEVLTAWGSISEK